MDAGLPWRTRRAESRYSDGDSQVVRKGAQGHSFESLDGWDVLSCTGLAKPTDLEDPPLGKQDSSAGGPRSGLSQNSQLRYLSVLIYGKPNKVGGVFSFRGLPPCSSFPACRLTTPQAHTAVLSLCSSQVKRVSPRNLHSPLPTLGVLTASADFCTLILLVTTRSKM